jgi:membrane peptidoglycan carboxypeptidase
MPEYAASVMVFNPKEKEKVPGFGGNLPATIWRDAMAPFLADKATSPFPPADPGLLNSGRPAPRPVPAPAPTPTDTPEPTEDAPVPPEGGGGEDPGNGGGNGNDDGGGNGDGAGGGNGDGGGPPGTGG